MMKSMVAVVISFSIFNTASAANTKLPPSLQALEAEGVHFVTNGLPAPKGMTGWAAYYNRKPMAFFVDSTGNVISGTLLDSDGQDVTTMPLKSAVRDSMNKGLWSQLEKTSWIQDGKANAPRTIYVFTDANCPYCNKFWAEARPWVDTGKVQIRHILVGVITEDSPNKAAAILNSPNPAKAFDSHARAREVMRKTSPLGSGHGKDKETGIQPLEKIPAAIQAKLDANKKTMYGMGFGATPAVIWIDDDGFVQTSLGVPAGTLEKVLGPR